MLIHLHLGLNDWQLGYRNQCIRMLTVIEAQCWLYPSLMILYSLYDNQLQ